MHPCLRYLAFLRLTPFLLVPRWPTLSTDTSSTLSPDLLVSFVPAEFDFRLVWVPGVKNVVDGSSYCPDFVPKEGDDIRNTMQVLLPDMREKVSLMIFT